MHGTFYDYDRLRGAILGRIKEMGEVIGVSESTMQRKLAEKVKLQLDELNRIAHYLGKDTRYFLMEREITEDDLKKMQKKKEKG
ncbi:hypothetical protein HYR99_14915 [Candidatus Poribacteria bacterium]|nr:hypothetical protein [Candidatus Poribacteria bacterium]